MAAYVIVDVEVKNPQAYEAYKHAAAASIAQYGGRYLIIGGQCDVVEGNWQPVFPVLIEFPSLEQAHRWYDLEEYWELKALRLVATRSNAVLSKERL